MAFICKIIPTELDLQGKQNLTTGHAKKRLSGEGRWIIIDHSHHTFI